MCEPKDRMRSPSVVRKDSVKNGGLTSSGVTDGQGFSGQGTSKSLTSNLEPSRESFSR